jgi:hypothetical protein
LRLREGRRGQRGCACAGGGFLQEGTALHRRVSSMFINWGLSPIRKCCFIVALVRRKVRFERKAVIMSPLRQSASV